MGVLVEWRFRSRRLEVRKSGPVSLGGDWREICFQREKDANSVSSIERRCKLFDCRVCNVLHTNVINQCE